MEKIFKKVIILFLFIFAFNFLFSNVRIYAEINSDYFDMLKDYNGNNADNEKIDDGEPGMLVGLLSLAILETGHLIQMLVEGLMGLFGPAVFPWSDYIIFNCVPILDVNFINPSQYALFGSGFAGGSIGTVLKNIYFTGVTIAVGFLGIVVAVMAIKMAISTIASEKARYKESIVTLLTTLLLIFGTHYLLAFTFYMNEKMVEVASNIVKTIPVQGTSVGTNTANSASEIVSGLGPYFYDRAKEQGGDIDLIITKIDKAAPIPTVLYLIFLIQSLMFLVAYFKRVFYVTILSIIAPFVVIYDFLGKAISM